MSKIDLSKAKIGDKFRTRGGKILEYVGEDSHFTDKYLLEDERGLRYTYYENGNCMSREVHKFDLVEQVFNETLDTIERDEHRNREMKEVVEKIKEENQELQELQRRQEVVELAEKMYTMLEIENFKYYLCNNGNCAFESEELIRSTFVRANTFINKKHQYLKEGKL